MQQPVRADARTAVQDGPAVHGGEHPTGLGENGEERAAIPRCLNGVHHDLRAARRDERVAVAVAPRPGKRGALLEAPPSGALGCGEDPLHIRREYHGVFDLLDG